MTTIAIVGAGPGLGAAVARRFGAEGFSVGLLSRSQERADGLAAQLAGTSIAFAGETAYAQLLHETLGEQGIHVAQLVIGGAIVAGDEDKDPARLADILWDLHSKRDRFRVEVATG